MNYPVAAIVLVVISGMCFSLLIITNYAFHDEDVGLFTKLNESAQRTMEAGHFTWWLEIKDHLSTGFGLAGVAFMGLAIFVFIVDSFGRRDSY